MAYQYATGMALNTADLLVKLQTFVTTTCGWTSVQTTITTGASGQYFVASSVGESGNERIFLRFHRLNGNAITAYGYLSWSAGNGRVQGGSTSTTTAAGTFVGADDQGPTQYWFFGSLDRIIIITRPPFRAGATDTLYAGLYTRQRSANFATCTNALTAGSAVTFSTANTSYFTVGGRYVIADDNNFESVPVTAVNAGVSVTLGQIQNSYAIGARLGEDVRPYLVTPQGAALGLQGTNLYPVAPPWRSSNNIANNSVAVSQGSFGLRGVETTLVERTVLDSQSSGNVFDLWPFFISDESHMSGGLLGTLTECYQIARTEIATDDTITVGGNTYHVINTAPGITATGSTAIGLAIRRS